ncbi:MAG: deoxyuridine 5-triphosphate nucleotidohydrolase, dUTP pyrophosphatase [Patescibacteria group bacterium]|jgi:deoxyuridine 5'-triphosphate nucleotidohydrolase|nr:deoxyuridine 5-triphosphate nucleotidohydrolase, dUTP pyrophosphatase [Patescibacteria group bacterium]
MEILLKQFDTELEAPAYKTEGAAAFDLCSRLEMSIQPQSFSRVPLNVAVQLPKGYWALLAARSSLHKKGLVPINGVGIIDADFCGDEDEYQAVLFNFTNEIATIERGERIMQVVILPETQFPLTVVDSLSSPSRGAFGTTGTK